MKQLSEYYELGAVAKYHNQPPLARTVNGDMTVNELLRWADSQGLAHCTGILVTIVQKERT